MFVFNGSNFDDLKNALSTEYMGRNLYITIQNEKQFKSSEQNRLFHGLLNIYHGSGCSSFSSYDEMRRHYKRIAGLMKVKYDNPMSQEGKRMLYYAIKALPLSKEDYDIAIDFLKGRIEQEQSWADATKKQASTTTDILIKDMISAQVQSKDFDDICRQTSCFY